MLAVNRNRCRMDLSKARIRHTSAMSIRAPDRGNVAPHSVRGEVENVRISSGREHNRISHVALHLSCAEISRNDPLTTPLRHNQIEHLGVRIHLYGTRMDLPIQRGVGT